MNYERQVKTIGEMNGLWAIGLKLSVVLMPFMVAWCSWASRTLLIVEERISNFPQDFGRRIAIIESITDENRRDIIQLQIELGIRSRRNAPP